MLDLSTSGCQLIWMSAHVDAASPRSCAMLHHPPGAPGPPPAGPPSLPANCGSRRASLPRGPPLVWIASSVLRSGGRSRVCDRLTDSCLPPAGLPPCSPPGTPLHPLPTMLPVARPSARLPWCTCCSPPAWLLPPDWNLEPPGSCSLPACLPPASCSLDSSCQGKTHRSFSSPQDATEGRKGKTRSVGAERAKEAGDVPGST